MEPRRRFRFLKQLSEGTFGRVYMAEMVTDNNFSSVVAIKLLHGKWLGHEEIVQRSRDEARVLGLLHHRNIIRVEDLTSINSQCAVIMEYLDGIDLKSLINHSAETKTRIPFKVIFEVMSATASALEAAYYREPLRGGDPLRLIHRDIKPSNIMLTREGDIKVLDFGTAQARFEDREAQTQALAFGSQAYMAPERLLGDPDAPSGDLFSLGITLYELLALESFGKVHIRPEPFDEAIRERIEALDLLALEPPIAADVRALLYRLLTYEADQRPNAREILEQVEDLSEQVNDASLRRFCRKIVSEIQAGSPLPNNPDDPLAGSTLFEDISALQTDNEPVLRSSPTLAFDSSAPPDPSLPAPEPERPPEPSALPAPPAQATMVPGDISPAPTPAPMPEKSIVDSITPRAPEPFFPSEQPPAPEPAPGGSSTGRWLVLAVVALGTLSVLGLGGAYAISQVLTPTAPEAPTQPETVDVTGIPGQRLEVGTLGPDAGTVILRLKGGRAVVKLDAATGDFQQLWDGTGELEIINLPGGTYKTRIKSEGNTVRTTFESMPNMVCTYTFTVGGGQEEWNRDCQ
ncbi:MAG: serine/threonine protein kinase [Myxococcota bacterium]|jgi:serine/threonine protein kinase